MPKTKATKTTKASKATKATKASKAKASKVVEDVVSDNEVVDSSQVKVTDVTLNEDAADAPAASAPVEDAGADSSAEEALPEDAGERALKQLDTLLAVFRVYHKESMDQHKIFMTAMTALRKSINTSRSRKRKTGAKKNTNTNSGIVELRPISKEMRKFLDVDENAKYSFTTLCSAITKYGKENDLQGMEDPAKDNKVDNRYMRLNKKLKDLFPMFDTVQAKVAAEGKTTLLKKGKERWVNRAGVMMLIGVHLLKNEKPEPSDEDAAEASA